MYMATSCFCSVRAAMTAAMSLWRATRTRPSYTCTRLPTSARRCYATPTATPASSSEPQSYVEKVVQMHAVDWPANKAVRAGDFVTIRPAHVMTHDNTGPVISKYVSLHTRHQRIPAALEIFRLGAFAADSRCCPPCCPL